MTVTLDTTIVQATDCLTADVFDDAVIMSTARGLYIELNAAGKDIWSRIANPCRVDALCAALEAENEAPPEQIRTDVIMFLDHMLAVGVVIGS